MEYFSTVKIADKILNDLRDWRPYIWHKSKNESIYIKFPHWALGSIRIGNHNSRAKYNYRFEIRTDIIEEVSNIVRKGSTFFISPNSLEKFYALFEKLAKAKNINKGDKQTYEQFLGKSIPEWKKRKYK